MKRLLLILSAVAFSTGVFGQTEVIRLYEGRAPGCENWTQQEYLFEYTTSMNPGEVGQCILNVTDPELWAYLPEKGTETGTAVVVCPGGGFTALSWHQEGPNVAKWFAAHGIAAFVLKYRIAYSGAEHGAKAEPDREHARRIDAKVFVQVSQEFIEEDVVLVVPASPWIFCFFPGSICFGRVSVRSDEDGVLLGS